MEREITHLALRGHAYAEIARKHAVPVNQISQVIHKYCRAANRLAYREALAATQRRRGPVRYASIEFLRERKDDFIQAGEPANQG